MGTVYIKPDATVKKIVHACFPAYHGNKYAISTDIPTDLSSYWDCGSRSYFAFYSLIDGTTYNVDSNHPMFNANNPRILDKLPERILLIRRRFSVGKDIGITIYANNSDLAPMLPEKHDISNDERIVLKYTLNYVSSYCGISNYRYVEAYRNTGISIHDWNAAKETLISKKLLTKAGAITKDGRNALA